MHRTKESEKIADMQGDMVVWVELITGKQLFDKVHIRKHTVTIVGGMGR